MIDSHCHLADEAFAADLDEVIRRARDAGLSGALIVLALGDRAEEERASRVARMWPEARFATGVHPHEARRFADRPGALDGAFRAAMEEMPGLRALGEIGLDYHYNFSPPDLQRSVFREQVRLARETGLPVVVHTREAEDDTIEILEREAPGGLKGVLHCFTGTERLARWALDFGLFISFAGIVTFPKAASLRQVARLVPASRLLVETDSPYLAPAPNRGKRNEPAMVTKVLDCLSGVRGEKVEDLDAAVTANYSLLFRP